MPQAQGRGADRARCPGQGQDDLDGDQRPGHPANACQTGSFCHSPNSAVLLTNTSGVSAATLVHVNPHTSSKRGGLQAALSLRGHKQARPMDPPQASSYGAGGEGTSSIYDHQSHSDQSLDKTAKDSFWGGESGATQTETWKNASISVRKTVQISKLGLKPLIPKDYF